MRHSLLCFTLLSSSLLHSFLAEDDPSSAHYDSVRLPVVDLAPFLEAPLYSDATRQQTSDEIAEYSREFGSFFVSVPDDHPAGERLSESSKDALFQAAHALFDTVPASVKHKCSLYEGGFHRGYLPFGQETGAAAYFEKKEGFCFGSPDLSAPVNSFSGPNIWPDGCIEESNVNVNELKTAKRVMSEFFGVLSNVSHSLIHAYQGSSEMRDAKESGGMDLDSMTSEGDLISMVRLFRIFSADVSLSEFNRERQVVDFDVDSSKNSDHGGYHKSRLVGSGPHTDWGLLTLVLADDVPGLQLKWDDRSVRYYHSLHSDSELSSPMDPGWKTVIPPSKHSRHLFVNCGDVMSLLSGGLFKSPLHRVVLPRYPPHRQRVSFVFFFYPNFDLDFSSVIGERKNREQRYSILDDQHPEVTKQERREDNPDRPVRFGEWIERKWNQVMYTHQYSSEGVSDYHESKHEL